VGGGGMLSDFVSFQIFIFISLSFAPWASMKFTTATAFSEVLSCCKTSIKVLFVNLFVSKPSLSSTDMCSFSFLLSLEALLHLKNLEQEIQITCLVLLLGISHVHHLTF
jgi:hypothetical protein